MKEEIVVQEEIKISKEEVKECIKHYEGLPDTFCLCIGEFYGNKNKIIKEIKKLSEVGKTILLMNHKFKEFEKVNKRRE